MPNPFSAPAGGSTLSPHHRWILLFLQAAGPSRQYGEGVGGRTRLMKELFLLRENSKIRPFYEDFEPSHFGPSSKTVLEDLDELTRRRLVSYDPQSYGGTYSTTTAGAERARSLAAEVDSADLIKLESVKKKWNRVPLNDLLLYVYEEFPNFTTRSQIKDAILRNPDQQSGRQVREPDEPDNREADESLGDD